MGKYNASFYLGNDYSYWEQFLLICKREGDNASKKLRDYIKDYVFKHGEGNSQTTISSFEPGGRVTIGNIEGRVRELCLSQLGDLHYRDIVAWLKERGVSDGSVRVASAERIVAYLKQRDRTVFR